MKIALAGGVGGAKLVRGLVQILPPEELAIVVNTGDDFVHLGLNICPDLDTVMYSLAGIADSIRGWGIADESWHFMDALARLGGETWFRLGDNDMATHIERTRMLANGQSLSDVTAILCKKLGLQHSLIPMSDDPAGTFVDTDRGQLAFQEYFVKHQCEPTLKRVNYQTKAQPSPKFAEYLNDDSLTGIFICPSNPMLSIEPILALSGVRETIRARKIPVVAVSPIVGGKAIKGPAAKIMSEMGVVPSPVSIAQYYEGLLTAIVIDNADSNLASQFKNVAVSIENTIMTTAQDSRVLATSVNDLVDKLYSCRTE
jgi:LPPG:FO 2-phospho-L-lactate transferase